jgi:hypothetical protein
VETAMVTRDRAKRERIRKDAPRENGIGKPPEDG